VNNSVGYPNYSSVITTKEGQGVSYTATENCWAKILITATDTSTAIVYVDNVQVVGLAGATGTAVTTLVPLKKGQTISTRTGHGGYNLTIWRCL
jgi:hypothetical protein